MARPSSLQSFIEAASIAFERAAPSAHARSVLRGVFDQLSQEPRDTETAVADPSGETVGRPPVCGLLPRIYASVDATHPLSPLIASFEQLEPCLAWQRAIDTNGTGSADFRDGHADVMIVGPRGYEARSDVWLGASLLAPHVRYPDHKHAPQEVYLVASDGEFQHGDSDWFSPGPGGSFYNSPNIKHAMRAGDDPLFAFWALLPSSKQSGHS
ncbi:transcriptional regulator (plasmid) [Methylobacterium sp. DM1]|nr:transcriptional regulator [Methylobacterium sp. DM1]